MMFSQKLNTHRIFKQLANALARLRVCAGWSETLLVAHTTLLEISCRGSLLFLVITNYVESSRHYNLVLSDFINLTQVHNFTVSAQDIFTFRRLSALTVSFTRILQVLMQIINCFALYY